MDFYCGAVILCLVNFNFSYWPKESWSEEIRHFSISKFFRYQHHFWRVFGRFFVLFSRFLFSFFFFIFFCRREIRIFPESVQNMKYENQKNLSDRSRNLTISEFWTENWNRNFKLRKNKNLEKKTSVALQKARHFPGNVVKVVDGLLDWFGSTHLSSCSNDRLYVEL